ncbi:MAG: menaquinone biosynthetic enzyme MqnA/MqnD family protein [Terriglobales bacterium]
MLRLAAIEFLNAAPLMFGLEADARFALSYTLPSACADALASGSADLGVIPVIELARIPGLVGLGGLGVASRASGTGEVRSILLVCRCRAPEVSRLALDPASRTSSALAQILLRHWFGSRFSLAPGAADWRQSLEQADAVLLIGDPALRLRVGGQAEAAGYYVYDLAREWRQFTGLPFVFALWGMRQPVFAAEQAWLPQRLADAAEAGLRHRAALVATWAPRLQLDPAEVQCYLAENVAYRLEAAHGEGLRRFFELAAADGLIASPQLPELREPVRAAVPA